MKRLSIIFLLLMASTLPGFSPTYLSFNTGQVSPFMEPRIDWAKYRSSARTIENMLVTTQGPVFRRPGTKYIAAQGDSTAVGRVISYEHSVDDSYVLLLENQTMRFFRDGGQILESSGTEDISGLDFIVAHYLLNETIGTNVADDDGGTHNGTASVDTSLLTTTGKVGLGSFDLDNQYDVEIAHAAAWSFTDETDDTTFSMAAWCYVTSTGGNRVIISKWRDDTSTREWWFGLNSERQPQMLLVDTSSDLSADRIAQWRLNEDAANTTVLDDTANDHDGTSTVGDTDEITATGKIGKCFDFAGSESVVITSDAATLSFGDGSSDSDFSISAWIYVIPGTAQQTIVAKWDDPGKDEWLLNLSALEELQLILRDDSQAGQVWKTSDLPLDSGWNFVVATYEDGVGADADAGDRITLYVDGAVIAATAFKNGGAYTAMEDLTGKVVIGARLSSAPKDFFLDKLDNVVLFDVLLTSANVLAFYNGGEGTETSATALIGAVGDDALDIGWRFLCATYAADDNIGATAANGIILYVDGAAVDSTKINDAAYGAMQIAATPEEVRIGSERNKADSANKNFWPDKLDEISVYSDVLIPTEIASLFTTTIFEIETPYLTADLGGIDFIKSEDTMYLAHGDYEPRQLTRSGHTLWSLDALNIGTGPFQAENLDTDLTITPSGAAFTANSNITLTAASGLFRSGHVGSIWQIDQIRETSQISGTFTANGNSISTPFFSGAYGFTTSGNSDGTITLMRSTNNGSSWRPALTALTDTDFDNPTEIEEDGAQYRVVMSNYGSGSPTYTFTITDNLNKGVVRITGVQDGTVATAIIVTALVDGTATSNWREGYFSDYRGWPETVTIHQQRLTFGGSITFPQTVWFGKTDPDDYTNFTEGTLDTSAFTVVLAGNNPIQWLLSQDYLLIGNAGSCGKYGDQGKAVTPTSPNYQEQTRQGAANLPAIIAGDAILYVERGLRKVNEFVFDFQSDKYLAPDLSVLSPEITESGIKDVAYQFRPYPILWCVLNNGDIATLTYQKNQSVVAWTKQITDGDFESVTVIPNTTEDEVWVTVKRTIDGVTETVVRYVEQFQPQDWGSDDNDAWFVDSGISYDGVETDSFTGADHLDGETVSIYADLLIESPEVVSSGAFTIDNAAERVLVGMAFTSKLETMPIVIDPQDKAMDKKIMSVWFDLYKTGYMEYGNGPDSTLVNMNFNNNLDLDNTATAQDLVTSRVKLKRGNWGYGTMMKQTVYVESDQPMPLTVRSITPSFNLFGN